MTAKGTVAMALTLIALGCPRPQPSDDDETGDAGGGEAAPDGSAQERDAGSTDAGAEVDAALPMGLSVGGGTINTEHGIALTVVVAWREADGGPTTPRTLSLVAPDGGPILPTLLVMPRPQVAHAWDLDELDAVDGSWHVLDEDTGRSGSFIVDHQAVMALPVLSYSAAAVDFTAPPAGSFSCVFENVHGQEVTRMSTCAPSCPLGDLTSDLYVVRVRAYSQARTDCNGGPAFIPMVAANQLASEARAMLAVAPVVGNLRAAVGAYDEGANRGTMVFTQATGLVGTATRHVLGPAWRDVQRLPLTDVEQPHFRIVSATTPPPAGRYDVVLEGPAAGVDVEIARVDVWVSVESIAVFTPIVTPHADGALDVTVPADPAVVEYRYQVDAPGQAVHVLVSSEPTVSFAAGTLSPYGGGNLLEVLASNRPLAQPTSDGWVVRRVLKGGIQVP